MNFEAGIPRGFLSPVIKTCKLILLSAAAGTGGGLLATTVVIISRNWCARTAYKQANRQL
jgi:hypothetical protein